ncbi:MAG: lactate utilization protein [SAR324 cluster bacterium]|nr:lactate utilization protein [SAR324 cluster bacterium]
MADARSRILERLRRNSNTPPHHANPVSDREPEWQAKQRPLGDLGEVFVSELEKVGSKVIRVLDWKSLPEAVGPWFKEFRIGSAITGQEPRLEPLRKHLGKSLGIDLHTYTESLEAQKEEIFSTDCGITTSRGGIADTGSVILVPTPQEPRLLSLALPVHLVVVEKENLFPHLGAFLDTGEFQRDTPSNLVLVSGASRTADIELTLTVGVHGPKVFLVALVG